jgi:ketoreductase RED2
MGRYEQKVVLITGSSSGIGEATARAFDAEGASVVVNSVTSVEAGEKVAASLSDGYYVQADVADPAACEALIAKSIERFGRLDVLVNNAGVTKVIAHHDLDAVDDETFRRILEVNVIGTFRLTRLAMPHLKATGDGAVINVTSVAGLRPTGSSVPYAVSKAALNHLSALLGNVMGPEVRVNAVAPGLVRTPWTADWGPVHDAMSTAAPLGRSGKPEDIAQAIVGVAANRYVTGQVIVVDGGVSLR